jgi:hypothetical protein
MPADFVSDIDGSFCVLTWWDEARELCKDTKHRVHHHDFLLWFEGFFSKIHIVKLNDKYDSIER